MRSLTFTTLLQCEKHLGLPLALPQTLQRRPPLKRVAPAATANAIPTTDRECLWPALPRCHPNCSAPNLRRSAYAPPSPRTSGSPRLAPAPEPRNGGLLYLCRLAFQNSEAD